MLAEKVRALAAGMKQDLVAIRRHLHANPELSYHEHNTALYVSRQLTGIGIEHIRLSVTGITGVLKGKKPGNGPVIALRADMDALPIHEANNTAYKSTNEGVMHACGHDFHMTSLLGTLRILKTLEYEFSGEVKFIFQPAEELAPGGALMMINDGVLENPRPLNIVGQHVMPELPAGKIGFHSGMYMASVDELYLTITGKGGHAAAPHQVIDPVLISSEILVMLQQLVSRRTNPLLPAVLSFGRFIADGVHNVIPDKVTIDGTLRTMDEKWRREAHVLLETTITEYAASMGAKADLYIKEGYPVLYNEPVLTASTRKWTEEYLGKEQVVDIPKWMAGEDFARYSHLLDSCFYRLGVQYPGTEKVTPLHTATFDPDEEALVTGAGLMAWIALRDLEENSN
ncbi:MAG: M20 metallopeptidase family protein [Pseudobacter sp.]|uniref:M20 metallopeptidase family protein n=1 Tax=Pseudobacter sp. TaxID=2045420 RepID=UPI003F7E53A0